MTASGFLFVFCLFVYLFLKKIMVRAFLYISCVILQYSGHKIVNSLLNKHHHCEKENIMLHLHREDNHLPPARCWSPTGGKKESLTFLLVLSEDLREVTGFDEC